jgi:hypothetical protein
MSGLNLGTSIKGGVSYGNGGYASSSAPSGGTATQMAFGPGYTQTGTPSTSGALSPSNVFGFSLWLALGATAALLCIRHSLPK